MKEGLMDKQPSTINWGLIGIYILVLGGLVALTVFVTLAVKLHVALGVAALFTVSGGIALAFFARGEGRAWRFVGTAAWLGALISLAVYAVVIGWLPPAIAIAALCFLAAGILTYVFTRRQNITARV
jgi:hypothetical protein